MRVTYEPPKELRGFYKSDKEVVIFYPGTDALFGELATCRTGEWSELVIWTKEDAIAIIEVLQAAIRGLPIPVSSSEVIAELSKGMVYGPFEGTTRGTQEAK